MFGYLVLLFTIVPAVELAILIRVGTFIGVGNTLFLIVFTGVVGAALARYQGLLVLMRIQESLNKGAMPNEELMDGLMILVGGIVLLTPGFITDAMGLFLLLPWTRALIKLFVRHRFEGMINRGQAVNFGSFHSQGRQFDRYDDFDVN